MRSLFALHALPIRSLFALYLLSIRSLFARYLLCTNRTLAKCWTFDTREETPNLEGWVPDRHSSQNGPSSDSTLCPKQNDQPCPASLVLFIDSTRAYSFFGKSFYAPLPNSFTILTRLVCCNSTTGICKMDRLWEDLVFDPNILASGYFGQTKVHQFANPWRSLNENGQSLDALEQKE